YDGCRNRPPCATVGYSLSLVDCSTEERRCQEIYPVESCRIGSSAERANVCPRSGSVDGTWVFHVSMTRSVYASFARPSTGASIFWTTVGITTTVRARSGWV